VPGFLSSRPNWVRGDTLPLTNSDEGTDTLVLYNMYSILYPSTVGYVQKLKLNLGIFSPEELEAEGRIRES
jgi:hypothetical protein